LILYQRYQELNFLDPRKIQLVFRRVILCKMHMVDSKDLEAKPRHPLQRWRT